MRYGILQSVLLAFEIASALPVAERLDERGLGGKFGSTKATIVTINDLDQDVTFTTSQSSGLGGSLPASIVVPKKSTSQGAEVKVGFFGGSQQSFSMTANTDPSSSFTFQLVKGGKGSSVAAAPGNKEFESVAMMAPGNPFKFGSEFTIYMLAGANSLATVVNGLIDEKVKPLAANLSQNPMTITIPGLNGIAVSLNEIPTNIKCNYGATRTMDGANMNANIAIGLTGRVGGTLQALGRNIPFDVDLTNLNLLTNADVDISSLKLKLNSLATSLDDVNISSEALGGLNRLAPGLLQAFNAAQAVPGLINTNFNGKVLSVANNLLSNIKLT